MKEQKKLKFPPELIAPIALGAAGLIIMIGKLPLAMGDVYIPPMLLGNIFCTLMVLGWTIIYLRKEKSKQTTLVAAIWLLNLAIMVWNVKINARVASNHVQNLLRFAQFGNAEAAKYWLDARWVSADAKDPQGRTALMLAAENGHTEFVQALLAHGADPHRKDDRGRTAWLLAREGLHAETAQALAQAGADSPSAAAPRFESARFEKRRVSRQEGKQRLILKIGHEADLDRASFWVGLFTSKGSSAPGCGPTSHALDQIDKDSYAADIDVNKCFPADNPARAKIPVTVQLGYFSVFDVAGNQLRVGKEVKVGRRDKFVFPRSVRFTITQ